MQIKSTPATWTQLMTKSSKTMAGRSLRVIILWRGRSSLLENFPVWSPSRQLGRWSIQIIRSTCNYSRCSSLRVRKTRWWVWMARFINRTLSPANPSHGPKIKSECNRAEAPQKEAWVCIQKPVYHKPKCWKAPLSAATATTQASPITWYIASITICKTSKIPSMERCWVRKLWTVRMCQREHRHTMECFFTSQRIQLLSWGCRARHLRQWGKTSWSFRMLCKVNRLIMVLEQTRRAVRKRWSSSEVAKTSLDSRPTRRRSKMRK